jgi:nickel-type superoxide dismutase maturation protease
MAPTLHHHDQLLVWWRCPRRLLAPGAVVVVALPDRPLSVKRLVRLDADQVWVEGDNPDGSTDSRQLGSLPVDLVRGRALVRLWRRPGLVRSTHIGPSSRSDHK